CVAIRIEGRFFLPEPRLSPCSEPTRLSRVSSTSGRHFSSMSLATGVSLPETPEADNSDFKNGRISVMAVLGRESMMAWVCSSAWIALAMG
ncbi:MAG: hypothetical protein IT315_11125, partial [Anaerolineales bacterium]|nr:hypothetical protein [Anaerolineales bacterium]